MRTLKFKAKRVDNGEWIEGFLIGNLDPTKAHAEYRAWFIHNGVSIAEPVQVDPETVCQATGLKLLNGDSMFEGDKFKDEDGEFEDDHLLVVWDSESCRFQVNVYGHAIYHNEGGGEEYSRRLSLIDENVFDIGILCQLEYKGNIHDTNPDQNA